MHDIKLTEEHDNKRVTLAEGQLLIIELPSNRTTGFTWDLAESDETILQQQGDPQYKFDFEGEEPTVGAGGAQVFTFVAKAPGKTRLKLIYHRPWEKGVASAKTFSVRIVVE